MAKEYTTKKYTEQRRECVKFTCDCCGTEARRPTSGDDAWGNTQYTVATTTVECKTGSSFPESGLYELTRFDVCVKCFQEKLIPFLESLGAKPTVEDISY